MFHQIILKFHHDDQQKYHNYLITDIKLAGTKKKKWKNCLAILS